MSMTTDHDGAIARALQIARTPRAAGGQNKGAPAPTGGIFGNKTSSPRPRPLRDNNPLDLTNLPNGQQWNGQIGSDGRFAIFGDPGAGNDAAEKNLLSKVNNDGLTSLNQIIGDPTKGWAPASDSNDPTSYAASVAQGVGVHPDDDVSGMIATDPVFRQSVLAQMAGVELNGPSAGTPQPNARGGRAKRAAGGGFHIPRHKGPGISIPKATKMHVGPIHSAVAGRTDHLPMTVGSGSYVIPADVTSAHGEGNTIAGFKVMRRTFGGNPYGGGSSPYGVSGGPYGSPAGHKDGGEAKGAGGVPIVAAGGEYVLSPEQVRAVGDGDLERGHRILDEFVTRSRAKLVKTLRKLPGPAK